MDDVSVLLEHVHLLNSLDGLDVEFLERRLQFLVVGSGGFVDFLGLSARCTFSSAIGTMSVMEFK